ncbi:MAG: UDP-N-acetylmuramoyl-L-alanine--D-glutamate ligase [Verrucomicrobia bacterium]|nr:UDP-N-acetylmuramoyl-L-alanine--D-glutamate ligase [Verrucomicrobiota bacterium]
MRFEGKRAAVLGLGSSGEAAAKLLCREGARVTVLDSGTPDPVRASGLAALGMTLVLGERANTVPGDYDLAVVSPGIAPAAPLFRRFVTRGTPLVGELELAFQCCRRPVIAITGTNGKTTTTQLIERVLNQAGVRTVACGNIGRPLSDALLEQERLDRFTLEVSSFQLETIQTFRPEVAVWLNLTPDHLDRYRDMDEYRQAKLRVFENQTAADFAVVNLADALPPLGARRITFSASMPGGDFWSKGDNLYHGDRHILSLRDTGLRGVHNLENVMATLGVALALGLDLAAAAEAIKSYRPLPHRCEPVGERAGVTFINDSKATNLDAMAKALESAEQPIVLIAGGKDKGFGYEPLRDLAARKVKRAVLIGEMAPAIEAAWLDRVPCLRAATLAEAVRAAAGAASAGDVVLFSPGTSSFDMFKSYADRGDQFRRIVQELPREDDETFP